MDLSPSNTNTEKTQTPPQAQPTNNKDSKSSSFTNGSLKRHHLHPTTVPPPPQPPSTVVSYKECLKNHAASLGGHALDGCGEFMPSSSSSNPAEPRSLTCAACGCHRNFHRRDTQEYSNPNFISFYHSPPPPSQPHHGPSSSPSPGLSADQSPSPISSPSPPPLSHHFPPSFHHHQSFAPHMLLALGNDHHRSFNFNFNSSMIEKNLSGKKRYRTKFTQEQKDKMHSFSEKLGWRMQKGDEGLVQEFCNEIGVSRVVFKVWMHNNKNTFRKRSSEPGEKINASRGDDSNNLTT
ncbi:zinc-finger homeodomain protein 10-like [Abrus precatorius]|uniref:Zinc-finger homeodomain protein 10-like n=1 Tax=Abrus precatorius TaxID=3816 RepID=A0A8B8LZK6_ABRPR|nr:zinc-finger homeodomain protein 10-like [Abrus precatorius]